MAESSTAFPPFPSAFGQDGGKFVKCYDKLADDLDEEMTKTIKENLDGMLIFAGLFAGVNSGFLALTLPGMSADPSDDTNTLLLQLLQGGTNQASPPTLPSKDFSPSSNILVVNILFSFSLTCAIAASFFAVLGKQWLVYYRQRSSGGTDKQRFEQLLRSQAADRWGLVPILDILLPTLLQSALIVFGIGLILYLYSLSAALSYVPLAFLTAALAALVISVGLCLWDPFCPFKTPASQLVTFITGSLRSISLISSYKTLSRWLKALIYPSSHITAPDEQYALQNLGQGQHDNNPIREPWGAHLAIHRLFKDQQMLRADLVRRVLRISEDKDTLYHAALNLTATKDSVLLERVVSDEVAFERLRGLYLDALARWETDGTEAKRGAIAYGTAFLHMVLSAGSLSHFLPVEYRYQLLQSPASTLWRPTLNSQLLNFLRDLEDRLRVDGVDASQISQRSQFLFIACRAIQVIAPWGWMTRGDLYILYSYVLAFKLPPWSGLSWLAFTIKLSTRRISDSANLLPNMTPLSWALENFANLQRMYRGIQDTNLLCEDVMQALRTISKPWQQKPPHDVYLSLVRSVCQAENETGIFTRSTVDLDAEAPEILAVLLFSIETNIRVNSSANDRSREGSLRQECLEFLEPKSDQPWPSVAWTVGAVTEYLERVMELGPSTENPLIFSTLQNLTSDIGLMGQGPEGGGGSEVSIWEVPNGTELRRRLSKVYLRFEAFAVPHHRPSNFDVSGK